MNKLKQITAAIFKFLKWLILVVALIAVGHYATVYLDVNYQAGSKSKIDECEHRLSRDINCVLVAVEDERN